MLSNSVETPDATLRSSLHLLAALPDGRSETLDVFKSVLLRDDVTTETKLLTLRLLCDYLSDDKKAAIDALHAVLRDESVSNLIRIWAAWGVGSIDPNALDVASLFAILRSGKCAQVERIAVVELLAYFQYTSQSVMTELLAMLKLNVAGDISFTLAAARTLNRCRWDTTHDRRDRTVNSWQTIEAANELAKVIERSDHSPHALVCIACILAIEFRDADPIPIIVKFIKKHGASIHSDPATSCQPLGIVRSVFADKCYVYMTNHGQYRTEPSDSSSFSEMTRLSVRDYLPRYDSYAPASISSDIQLLIKSCGDQSVSILIELINQGDFSTMKKLNALHTYHVSAAQVERVGQAVKEYFNSHDDRSGMKSIIYSKLRIRPD